MIFPDWTLSLWEEALTGTDDCLLKAEEIQKDFKEYVEDNGVVLAVCGGYQLLGNYYQTSDGLSLAWSWWICTPSRSQAV